MLPGCELPSSVGRHRGSPQWRLLALGERDRGHDVSAAKQINAVLFSRAVAQPTLVDQRGGATTIEVQSRGDAEINERSRQLIKRHARVAPGSPVAGDGHESLIIETERGPGVATPRDVGVELPGARGEAFGIVPEIHCATFLHQEGPRLQQVPSTIWLELIPPRDPNPAAAYLDARPRVRPW